MLAVFLFLAAASAAPKVIVPAPTDVYHIPHETTVGTPAPDSFVNISIDLQPHSEEDVTRYNISVPDPEHLRQHEGDASNVTTEKPDAHQGHYADDKDRPTNPYYNIGAAFLPVLSLMVLAAFIFFLTRNASPSIVRRCPGLSMLFPFQHGGDDASTYCQNKLIDNNVNFIHFMKTLSNPFPKPIATCNCCCCASARKPLQKHISNEAVPPALPPKKPDVTLPPIVTFKKKNEQVDIRGMLSSSSSSGSPDTRSITTISSSSITSDCSFSSSSGPRCKSDGSDSSPVINVNPFNPEYVYAALAPDVQYSTYHEIAETFVTNAGDRTTGMQGVSVKSPPSMRKVKMHGNFRSACSLETICE